MRLIFTLVSGSGMVPVYSGKESADAKIVLFSMEKKSTSPIFSFNVMRVLPRQYVSSLLEPYVR